MAKRKIALFGGTFDPVHLGHTVVAADAAEKIGAEKVIFIPSKQSPLKGFFPIASDYDRLRIYFDRNSVTGGKIVISARFNK